MSPSNVCDILRGDRSNFGPCVCCSTEEAEAARRFYGSSSPFVLYKLNGGKVWIVLCEKHETAFLSILLNNYARRLRRGKPVQSLAKDQDPVVDAELVTNVD